MTSINKTVLIGFVGNPPEVRYFPSGDPVMNLSVATTNRWLDKKTEEWKEMTEWHKVSVIGKVVPGLALQIVKGSQVYVEGMLRTRKWKDANGNDKQVTEIKADICKVFEKELTSSETVTHKPPAQSPVGLDDIPF